MRTIRNDGKKLDILNTNGAAEHLNRLFGRINYPGRPRQRPAGLAPRFFPSSSFRRPHRKIHGTLLPYSSSESSKASQTQRAAAMATPDAEQPAPTEPARWRDLDMLLSRPGNLVAASFDPSPTVSGPGPPPPIHPLFSRVLLVGG